MKTGRKLSQDEEAIPAIAKNRRGEDDAIVCPCTDLTRSGLRRMVTEGAASFDELLNTTAANGVVIGGRCTACRLDLEYLFTEFQKCPPSELGVVRKSVNRHDVIAARHRIYRVIDRLSPMVPIVLRESAVVIVGTDIRQWVVVANDSMMFEDTISAPPITVDVTIRDHHGAVRHQCCDEVATGEEFRLDVSQYIDPPPNGLLAIGSVEILRHYRSLGNRGTTRPQIVIEAPAGNCAVHTQDGFAPTEKWFAYYHQPEDQRFFLGLVNTTGRPRDFVFSYPLGTADVEPSDTRVTVPPHGAGLHEAVLPDDLTARLKGKFLRLRCKPEGRGSWKINFICASRNLDRFSIDHAGQ